MTDTKNINTIRAEGENAAAEYTIRAQNYLSEAQAFVVDSPLPAKLAATDLTKIKALQKDVDGDRRSITRVIDENKAKVMDLFRPAMNYLSEVETTLKGSLNKFLNEEEAKRRAEEAIKRKAAEEVAARMREEAAVLAKQGDVETARTLNQQAAMLPALVQAGTPTTILDGLSSKEVWEFEIFGHAQIPREYLMIDETKIRKVVQAMKSETNIPGVRVYSSRQLSAKAG